MQENTNIITPFVLKVWNMVNDSSSDDNICWSGNGKMFIINKYSQFCHELLPVYFKHNNMSSFVRQLNLYGFHKIPCVSGNLDRSDMVQFYHPYFRKGHPELLKNIKRKVSFGKAPKSTNAVHDDLSQVLTDVKQLRGRQSSVDSQLSAMKQENAVLWRELAMLRQKHVKQQQIVNKLIQFLVTLVQPTNSGRMGVGVKRRMPLMLHGSPAKKKTKNNIQQNDGGPTIHELESEVALSPEQLLEEASGIEADSPLIDSPVTPLSQVPQDSIGSQSMTSPSQNGQNDVANSSDSFWDQPEFVNIDDVNPDGSNSEEDLINTLEKNAGTAEKVFLNPNNRDSLLGTLLDTGSMGSNKQINNKQADGTITEPQSEMRVATKSVKINNGTDLDLHLDSTQNELDQLKDILNGCSTFDANALLGLFDHEPGYESRSSTQNKENPIEDANVLAVEDASPENNIIDFTELFDEDLNNQDCNMAVEPPPLINPSAENSGIHTPLILKNEPPTFPNRT